jgi:hypothetical protein
MTLNSNDELTQLIRNKNLFTWNELTKYIKSLPYGRTINRTDLSLVLKECKGSCSSKHALLKKVAILNKVPNIKLILGLYKMNSNNTPKIGNVLHKNTIDYLPEAHCYLMVNGERIDYTSSSSDFKRIKNDVVFEKEIEPHEIAKFKVEYHKNYLKTWIKEQNIPFSFDEIWNLREECISNLSA